MAASTESTLLVVHAAPLSDAARTALRASAERLGHMDGCSFASVQELESLAPESMIAASRPHSSAGAAASSEPTQTVTETSTGTGTAATDSELASNSRPDAGATTQAPVTDRVGLAIYMLDPWAVVAVDDEAIAALRDSFGAESAELAPDRPVEARGYTLVAVPAFEACLDDQPAKRIAWHRLQAAAHPGNPLS